MVTIALNLAVLALLCLDIWTMRRFVRELDRLLSTLDARESPESGDGESARKEAELEARESAAMQEGIQNILGYSVGGGKDGG